MNFLRDSARRVRCRRAPIVRYPHFRYDTKTLGRDQSPSYTEVQLEISFLRPFFDWVQY